MTTLLYIAAFLIFAIGLAHSVLGEKYILIRLFRRENLPKIFGSTEFTIRTLRFAWHLTTIAWWSLAIILILLVHPPVSTSTIGQVIGITFLIHFAIALIGSRGKHFSWPIFLAIGVIVIFATCTWTIVLRFQLILKFITKSSIQTDFFILNTGQK